MATKRLNADSFAKQAIPPLQPVINVNLAADVVQQAPPVQKQMPAPLKKALGIDQS
ncbi:MULTISPECIES: hypothetical protein [unclassified Bradyrhizobium]|uniref:hypothetical protein n=1 Tax=unclassified Bradyrhizobium TaxID=2631580 RepID=UPI001FF970B0|nr:MULTISPECIES: hypothetical protein [unclassified Bradyrhizobium]MCK1711239.1 hypothetical protein [Bradyrhizobium sp. 143]MCK1725510.1 hypothetical protein [Bradyrhizobium sp. 142]